MDAQVAQQLSESIGPSAYVQDQSVFDSVLVGSGFDQSPRWRAGERLHHLVDAIAESFPDDVAVDYNGRQITFAELVGQSRILANSLSGQGIRPNERVALLLDDPLEAYLSMLAVSVLGATFVPLDVSFPDERIGYILRDAGVASVVTPLHLNHRIPEDSCAARIFIDAQAVPGSGPMDLLPSLEPPSDTLAYIIYTSGTTGRPKGVGVHHSSICNFIRVAAETYGFEPADRVYQGMTIAFDFSVEELWVPWQSRATVVPKNTRSALLGADLEDFILEQGITALCCVPTLLSTLDERRLFDLRFLLVSGEACPQDMVRRWYREGRRFLNVYGPTEATVTATWTELHPNIPVTLGVPLPTYSAVILEPGESKALPHGELGEICVAGIGLASGYIGNPEQTDRVFIDDFLAMPGNLSNRIYRTGDLGRVTASGDLEFHGRIDTQVKIRGYRIELSEIESVVLSVPNVAQAVVAVREPHPGNAELVAYYCARGGMTVDTDLVFEELSNRLPPYMVPAYLEKLDAVPMTSSDKVDRSRLPDPVGRRMTRSGAEYVSARSQDEARIVSLVAAVLSVPESDVSTTAHFFDDLGMSSLLVSKLCASLRGLGLRSSIQSVYGNPTVSSLAKEVFSPARPTSESIPSLSGSPHRASSLAYFSTGVAQLAMFVVYCGVLSYLTSTIFHWAADVPGYDHKIFRSLVAGTSVFAFMVLCPIVVKWTLVGRWTEQGIPLWGLAYFRFWLVRVLVRTNPIVLFAGTPVYSLYFRALGARVGKNVLILTKSVPVCADLLTVGSDSVIRKDSIVNCYRARNGRIETGPIRIGSGALVCEATILDIGTSMGDDSQLGHASSLHQGQSIPARQRWHGSPARPGVTDFGGVPASTTSRRRTWTFGLTQIAQALLLSAAGSLVVLEVVFTSEINTGTNSVTSVPLTTIFAESLVYSVVAFFGSLLVGLLASTYVPRLSRRLLKPGVVYPLFGFRHSVQRLVRLMSNRPVLHSLFGDSSMITRYVQGVGYTLVDLVQTGSNFGTTQKHEFPTMTEVGSRTMISDGLSLAHAEYSSTSFRVRPVKIGSDNFLGNKILFPPDAKCGDNVLLATKVGIPVTGEILTDTGLLGSPAFAIPRSVTTTRPIDEYSGDRLKQSLRAKDRHNAGSMMLFLAVRWGQLALTAVLVLGAAAVEGASQKTLVLAVSMVLSMVLSLAYLVLAERAAMGFRRLIPRTCSIYDPYFWRHERFWKMLVPRLAILDGTPFKPMFLRALGVRTGRRLYDEGCVIPERSLVTIGDDCTLAGGSVIQCHSLEDGNFTSDYTRIGNGCTIGAAAFVHYGVHIADGAIVEADSFVMKGTEISSRQRWRGNPAEQMFDSVS